MNFNELDLHEKMLERLEKQYSEVFIIEACNDRLFSYELFLKNVFEYIQCFDKLGIKKQDKLMLILDNSIDLVFLYFAGLIFNLTLIPIDPQKGINEINKIRALEVDAWTVHEEKIQLQNQKLIGINTLKALKSSSSMGSVSRAFIKEYIQMIDLDKSYLVMFTSGTSGEPKGVSHSFRNLLLTSIAFSKKFNFGSENVFYQNMPMTYMAGFLNQIILPFITGGKVVIGNRFSVSDAMQFWRYPIKYKVNTFWFNPTMLSLLVKLDRSNEGIQYSKDRKIIGCVGTAPLYDEVKQSFESKYKIDLYQSYGLSELLFITTNNPKEVQAENSVGKLLEGVELKFEEDGEILVRLPWTFLGYTNIDTQSFYKGDYYKTGDVGEILEDGSLVIKDRKKDIIIRGGINLSPRSIEVVLSDMKIFNEFAIIAEKDQTIVEKIVCFYVKDHKIASEKMEVNRTLNHHLGEAYKIDEFVQIEEIPKNINGKVDKMKLQSIYKERINDHKN